MSTLKERYDLGVGPLREALSQLVAEHLVNAISQKGYRVAPMSLEEMNDIYDARANLEAMIITLAIERGDDAWEASVLAHSHTLAKVVEVKTREQRLTSGTSGTRRFTLPSLRVAGPSICCRHAATCSTRPNATGTCG